MTTSTSPTGYDASAFVPAEVKDATGGEKWVAVIKSRPQDFRVCERTTPEHLCTIGPESDIAGLNLPAGVPGIYGVTVVKSRLTTYDVVYALADKLRLPKDRVTAAGMKDFKAETSQRVHVSTWDTPVTQDHLLTLVGRRFEENENGWWLLKDVAPANKPLAKGMLVGNAFELTVLVPGRSALEIEQYVAARLALLQERLKSKQLPPGVFIPNAFGGQRLGRRRNQFEIGSDLIRLGAKAAIERFLCENGGLERPLAQKIRHEMAELWGWMEHFEEEGMPFDQSMVFQDMLNALEQADPRTANQAWKTVNLPVEHQIVRRLCKQGTTYDDVMKSMSKNEFSLWIGAVQGWWFNQALAGIMRGEIPLPEDGEIPLLSLHRESLEFYLKYLPQALPLSMPLADLPNGITVDELPLTVDPEVSALFLEPKATRNWVKRRPGREAFVPVLDLKHHAEDGVWKCSFELRSGSYATIFLDTLFAISPEDRLDDRYSRPSHCVRR